MLLTILVEPVQTLIKLCLKRIPIKLATDCQSTGKGSKRGGQRKQFAFGAGFIVIRRHFTLLSSKE